MDEAPLMHQGHLAQFSMTRPRIKYMPLLHVSHFDTEGHETAA